MPPRHRHRLLTRTLTLASAALSIHAQSLPHPQTRIPALATGNPATLHLEADNLPAHTHLWTSFAARVLPLPASSRGASFEVHAPAHLHGIGWVRLLHPTGCSPPTAVLLDPNLPPSLDVPAARHAGADDAHPLPDPGANTRLLTGHVPATGSVWFVTRIDAGQSLHLEVLAHRLGSSLDPLLIVRDAQGREHAAADDTPGFLFDAALSWTAPVAGLYRVELRDARFAGGPRHTYLLRRLSAPPEPVDYLPAPLAEPPADTPPALLSPSCPAPSSPDPDIAPSHAPVQPPVRFHGLFNNPRQPVLRFPINLPAQRPLQVRAATRTLGSDADLLLRLVDADGSQLAASDPAQPGDGRLDHTPDQPRAAVLEVRELTGATGPSRFFQVDLLHRRPPFELEFDAHTGELHPDTPWSTKVQIRRNGHSGPVRLRIPGLPAAVRLEGDLLAADATETTLTLIPPNEPSPTPDARLLVTTLVGVALDSGTANENPDASTPADPQWDPVPARNPAAWRQLWPELLHPPHPLDGSLTLWMPSPATE